jgi:hypothetical protein
MKRYMKVFKGHLKNMARLERNMVNGYAVEETLGFCTEYIQEVIPTRRTMWDDNENPTMHDEILEGNGHPCRLSADLKA